MKTLPRIKNPITMASMGGLLSLTLGAMPIYADTPNTAPIIVKPRPKGVVQPDTKGEVTDVLKLKDSSEITEADVNARTEQYEEVDAKGALTSLTGKDINDTKFLKDNGIVVGGWANGGITYNTHNPANGYNGPVTFNDRSNVPMFNQLNLYVGRAVATEGKKWDFGGRVDFMYGTDAIFTQAYGVTAYDVNTGQARSNRNAWDLNLLDDTTMGIALPQAYGEAYVPVGNGLNVKAGHFYTPIGYEVVTAPDNFFYSHAYTMQYGEPFTHTGAMGNYAVDNNWGVMGGLTTGSSTGGWDGGFNQGLGNWGGLFGTTWTSNDKGTSANVSGTYSGTSEQNDSPWALYSVVLKHNLNEKTHMILQHDHGFANNVLAQGANVDAQWYGINSHTYYDIKDNLSIGLRAEWFRDQNGFRVCSPGRVAAAADNSGGNYAAAGSYGSTCVAASWYQVTAGLTYKPKKWLNIRPNIRYDYADGTNINGSTYMPFGNANQTYQVLMSTDVVITF
ncbi:MAG: porin [Methylococcales bacterium]|nr:porin [Methylococcales bacterium]